jgi:hypothetical protein
MDKPTVPEPSFGDPTTPLSFSLNQAAALCGVSAQDLRDWTARGIVSATGSGDHRRYDRDALRQILALRESGQAPGNGRQSEFSLPATEMDDPHLMMQAEMFFALNPGTEATVASLADQLGVDIDQMQRVLDNMVRLRRVSSLRRGSEVLYQAPRRRWRGPSIREQRVRATRRTRVPSRPL